MRPNGAKAMTHRYLIDPNIITLRAAIPTPPQESGAGRCGFHLIQRSRYGTLTADRSLT